MARESKFEAELVEELLAQYPGAVILKNDSSFFQGIPDRLILYGPRWAAFEAKAYERARHRINQDYYVKLFNDMSYASFVYPENKETFLHELQQALRPRGSARLSVGEQVPLGKLRRR